MKNLRGSFCAAVAALLLTTGIAAATTTIPGVVDAISKHAVTVGGVSYALDDTVALEDMAHQPITLPEIHPGTHVELDIDDEGKLAVVRAAVVR